MNYHYVLDENGNPFGVDLMTWARWFEQPRVRRVALTQVGQIEVSTVFLGLDHNFSRVGPPLLWETMTFGDEDERLERYSSRDDALAGHERIVAEVRAVLAQKDVAVP